MTAFINDGTTTATGCPQVPPDRSARVCASAVVSPVTRLSYSLVPGQIREQASVLVGDGTSGVRMVLDQPDPARLVELLLAAACRLRSTRGECR